MQIIIQIISKLLSSFSNCLSFELFFFYLFNLWFDNFVAPTSVIFFMKFLQLFSMHLVFQPSFVSSILLTFFFLLHIFFFKLLNVIDIHRSIFLFMFLNDFFDILFICFKQFFVFFIILFKPWLEIFTFLDIIKKFIILLFPLFSMFFNIFDFLLYFFETFLF